jgi:hypothetical protein
MRPMDYGRLPGWHTVHTPSSCGPPQHCRTPQTALETQFHLRHKHTVQTHRQLQHRCRSMGKVARCEPSLATATSTTHVPPTPAPHNQQGARGQHRHHPAPPPPRLRALPRRGTPRRVSTEAAVSPGMVFSPSNTLEAARPNSSRFTISWHAHNTPKRRSQGRSGRRENGRGNVARARVGDACISVHGYGSTVGGGSGHGTSA